MKKSAYVKTLLISIIFSISFIGECNAKEVKGYIITSDLDTIYGEIKVNKFNQHTGGYLVLGIYLKSYHSQVAFKKYNDKHFNFYEPKDIHGFGFKYKSVNYKFQSFKLVKKSIIKKERTYNRFLQLIYSGKLSLYRDVRKISRQDINFPIFDKIYYLNNNTTGINEVITTNKTSTLSNLLTLYNVEPEFINTISQKKIEIREINNILKAYDVWLHNKKI